MQASTDAGHEGSLFDIAWPEPIVSTEVVEKHAPWLFVEGTPAYAYAPPRLVDIVNLVTSRENACRFCYGASWSAMRISGYSDEQIRDLERDVALADGATREVVRLARKLARSDPRPVRAELAALERHGLSQKAVGELVFSIAGTCFANRISTFLALQPDKRMEKFAGTLLGRVFGPLLIRAHGMRTRKVAPSAPVKFEGSLAPLLGQLPDSPISAEFAALFKKCLEAPALDRRVKLQMLAVIARTLDCSFCEDASRSELIAGGYPESSFRQLLETLSAPDLLPRDKLLLEWARETVHYDTAAIQKRTRKLAEQVDTPVLLEAIGTAAVSNTAVRLAMLLP